MRIKTSVPTIILATLVVASAAGGDPRVEASAITWDAAPGYLLTLTVAGSGGVGRHEFRAGESPTLTLYGGDGQPLADGIYTWQLSAAPELSRDEQQALAAARDRGVDLAAELGFDDFVRSGAFTVAGGAFVVGEVPAGGRDVASFTKGQVVSEDLIVKGSSCIGTDCSDSESFGYDTLMLKENNLRIRFHDTSSTANFPTNDWELTANDNANGGLPKFSIRDVDAGNDPFTVAAGAGTNALFIDGKGNVGLGTATPGSELQVTAGNSPTLRFDQDGTSGFSAYSWDVGGNETNFYVRDHAGDALPLRIEAGAPSDSLYLDAAGSVGIGTSDPKRSLHVRASSTAQAAFETTAAGIRWNVGTTSNGSFGISRNGSGNKELELTATGGIYFRDGANLLATLAEDGALTTTGSVAALGAGCTGACDQLALIDSDLDPIEVHAASMYGLGYLPAMGGPTVDGDTWNLSEKIAGLLSALVVAHRYIDQLNQRVVALESAVNP